MGLAAIDPHSQKEHTEIHKIPKFGVYQASFYRDTTISKLQNLQRNVWHPDALSDSVRMALHFFVNFDIFKWLYLSYYWVYLPQTWDFCKTWSTLYDYVDQ